MSEVATPGRVELGPTCCIRRESIGLVLKATYSNFHIRYRFL